VEMTVDDNETTSASMSAINVVSNSIDVHDCCCDNLLCRLCNSVTNVHDSNGCLEFLVQQINLHQMVSQSGTHNFLGCRIPVYSKLNIAFFRHILVSYHDRLLCDFLEFGFPIGFDYDVGVNLSVCTKVRNHGGATGFPKDIEKFLKTEVELQAVLGPFLANPLFTSIKLSPLNSVPKKDSVDRRVILDLSFPAGSATNDGIQKDWYLGEPVKLTYPSVDSFVELIKRKGRGCLLFKRDLKRAYRQIPIDPGDLHLVGFCWKDHIFLDRVLSMGLRSAAQICQRVTNSVTYILSLYGIDILNYLDDFAGAELPSHAVEAFELLGETLQSCGLEESLQKAFSPSTFMVFIGVGFDSITLTLVVTAEKVAEILDLVVDWLKKRAATLKQLQSLLGKLHFISSCVRPGRLFVSRLLTWLRSIGDASGEVTIAPDIHKDLLWWLHFLPCYNGVSMMMLEEWSVPDEVFSCDACLSGCGGWMDGTFFHCRFPDFILQAKLHINCLELLTVMVCVKLWGAQFSGKRIRVLCDNLVSVTALNSGAIRNSFMQSCLREICFSAATFEFDIRGCHIEGALNRVPDLLSRWELDDSFSRQFMAEVGHLNLVEVSVEDSIFRFTHDW
jgi:hypothetical protein